MKIKDVYRLAMMKKLKKDNSLKIKIFKQPILLLLKTNYNT